MLASVSAAPVAARRWWSTRPPGTETLATAAATMGEPLPDGVEGRRIGNRNPYAEIIAVGWLRYVDGNLVSCAGNSLN